MTSRPTSALHSRTRRGRQARDGRSPGAAEVDIDASVSDRRRLLECPQRPTKEQPRGDAMPTNEEKQAELRRAALEYHEFPVPGKIAVMATKQVSNQRDLALAYSPGVAAACEEIAADPSTAFRYTARGNLVGVVTNGTAVLGLGDIGPLAAKPVMEGKAVLFKKFAGIDVFDIELNERNLDKLVDAIAALEP